MLQISKIEDYVVCPYNSAHRLRQLRLAVHLERCARNYPSTLKVTCPYNTTHIFSVAEMTTHVDQCMNRPLPASIMTDKLTSAEPQLSSFCVESAEDWDAEPPAPTYDPKTHCETAFIIRNPQGNPRAARREFRAIERRRFIENGKF